MSPERIVVFAVAALLLGLAAAALRSGRMKLRMGGELVRTRRPFEFWMVIAVLSLGAAVCLGFGVFGRL